MALKIRNPHSVLAALDARPRDVLEIAVPSHLTGREQKSGGTGDSVLGRDAWLKVLQVARSKGIEVTTAASTPKGGFDSRRGGRGTPTDRNERSNEREDPGRVGVAEALIKERQGSTAEDLFRGAQDRAEGKGLWIALDCLTDPHNVGAIFRTASFFGVQGILMTQERSSPLTASVYDVASGGIEHVPFAIQPNLQRAFEVAKENGLWILGTSEHAKQGFDSIQRDRPWLLVLGNEEKGMRRLTEESCDVTCQISPLGQVTSLNVSVAAGVMIARLTASV